LRYRRGRIAIVNIVIIASVSGTCWAFYVMRKLELTKSRAISTAEVTSRHYCQGKKTEVACTVTTAVCGRIKFAALD